ncbi:MAG: class I SAM-dependent methyltransferase [Leptolyngbyaceae cyanobacterium CSU_1_4]|nr:class I SAM-dependent methyltransferase [Leptolyngbyaceae cyanobacterium CSU_1_4]
MTVTPAHAIKTCPVCNSTTQNFLDINHYTIRRCRVCAHQFIQLEPRPESVKKSPLPEPAEDYGDYFREAKFLKLKGQHYAQLMSRYFKRPGRMLDVGSAAGFVLQGFIDRDWKASGIEPNAHLAEQAQTSGLRVVQDTLEDFRTTEKYDLITFIQVIAHFTQVQEAFRIAAEATQSKGFWLIETGNRDSLKAQLWGENWQAYHPPSTLHWFSPKDLKRLASQYGFQEVARGKPHQWVNVAHAKFSLRQKKVLY